MNGSGVISTSNTRDIQISDGITATLLAISGTSPTTTTPVDITVTRSISALGTALSAFADAYNAAVDEIDTQRGQGAGALAAQSVVTQLSGILSSISTFSSNGQVSGLNADLGLELQTNGHLTYTALQFMSADLASSTGITSFFGSAAGGGFLKNATDLLNSVEDPTTGLLKTAETDWQSQITNIGTTIADETKPNRCPANPVAEPNGRFRRADRLHAAAGFLSHQPVRGPGYCRSDVQITNMQQLPLESVRHADEFRRI